MVGPDPPIHSETYLEGRFQLFERFCYPSVRNQTTQDFSWIVSLSDGTPNRYRDRMTRLADGMPNLRPVYLDEDAASRFFDELGSYVDIPDGVTRVISTRVCNDDALAIDYIERMQAICDACPNEEYFVSFPRGLRYSARYGFSVASRVTLNQFLSLHSLAPAPGRPLDHMHLYDHTRVGEAGKRIIVDDDRVMWLEVDHETNVSNRMYMSDYARPVFNTSVYARFSLDPANFRVLRSGRFFTMLVLAGGARAARAKNRARRVMKARAA
jgi:hypothetical protein